MLDAHSTPEDRAMLDTLDWSTDQTKIHDLLVSCYTASGEDGRPEDVHEQRLSDRSCRCGHYGPKGA